MDNITPLFGAPDDPDSKAELVETLEDLLDRARAGQLIGFAYAGLQDSRLAMHGLAGDVGSYAVPGALEIVKARVAIAIIQCEDEE